MSSKTTTHPAAAGNTYPLLPHPTLPDNPSWDRAKELHDRCKRSVVDLVSLGLELHALQVQLSASGSRTDLDEDAPAGWKEEVRRQLGMAPRTAYRIILRSQLVLKCQGVADGETVEFEDDKGVIRTLVPTPADKDRAVRAVRDIFDGAVSPGAAWAGLVGEHCRVDVQGAGRAVANYVRTMERALTSLGSGFGRWDDLDTEGRAALEAKTLGLVPLMPSTLAKALVKALDDTHGRR